MRKFFISLLFLVIFNISLFAGDEIKISEIMKKIENNIEYLLCLATLLCLNA